MLLQYMLSLPVAVCSEQTNKRVALTGVFIQLGPPLLQLVGNWNKQGGLGNWGKQAQVATPALDHGATAGD